MADETTKFFVKVYMALWESGLAARLGAERTFTLQALAAYMDKHGRCWPMIEDLAKRMGVSRQTASKRINDLAKFRWNDQAIIEITRRHNGATWNNVYQIASWCQIAIFDGKPSEIEPDATGDDRRVDTTNIEKARAAKEAKKRGETSGDVKGP